MGAGSEIPHENRQSSGSIGIPATVPAFSRLCRPVLSRSVRRHCPARRGFTILEIVLAIVIIGAACVPIVQSMLASRTSLLASLEELSATSEATRTMEALKRLPFAELPVSIEDQPALDTAWDDQHFAWPPSAEGGPAQPRKTPAASLATLGPPVSKEDYRRSLAVSLVPVEFPGDTGPRAFKLVDVRISWKRPGAPGDAEGSVALCTLLGPP